MNLKEYLEKLEKVNSKEMISTERRSLNQT